MRLTLLLSGLIGFFAASALPAAPAAETAVPPPSLLFSPADAQRINTLAASDPSAAQARADLLRRAADWPAAYLKDYGLAEWSVPWQRGGWASHYICPEHGVRLKFAPGHNVCPVCGKDFAGWPYDYEVFRRQHAENSEAARDLGVAFRLTGDPVFAAKARQILLGYAEIYPALSIGSHKEWPRPGSRSGGRVTSQTLNESDFVLEMAFAYDLVRETLSPAERALIERDLLRSASDVIARRVRSLGNWTARHNMAHLAVGLVLKDQALIDLAINSEFGLRDQLRRSVTAEGVWYEGSWSYHFYAMSAVFLTCEMAARAGIDVPERDKLRLALNVPLESALPDSTLPNFNDAHFTPLAQGALLYDMGLRIFGDRRYRRVVRAAARGIESLLWGAALAGEGDVPELTSSILPETGFATLRAAGSDHTVAVKFGPHAGGHSHFDRLNFVSFAHGRMHAVDPGTQSYAFPTHKTWDRVTLAHNTLVVDEANQAESAGAVREWHPGPVVTALRLADTTSYPQARLERLFVHTAGYTLEVFDAAATDGKSHRFDWIYHNAGTASSPLRLTPYAGLPKINGYQHLSSPRAAVTGADWEATFTQSDSALRLRMLGESGTTVVLGSGLGEDLSVPVPFALARRQGPAARFVSLLEPFRGDSRIRSFRLVAPDTVRVESEAGVDEIVIAPGRFRFTRQPAGP